MAEALPPAGSLEAEHFLANVRLIQRRGLITAVVLVLTSVLLAGWIWWQTCLPTPAAGGHASLTSREAELAGRLRLAAEQLRLSLRLFAAMVLAVSVGAVVLIRSYARQIARLLELIGRRPA